MRKRHVTSALLLLLATGGCKGEGKAKKTKPAPEQTNKAAGTQKAVPADKTTAEGKAGAHDSEDNAKLPQEHKARINAAFAKAGLKLGPAPISEWEFEAGGGSFFDWTEDGLHYITYESVGHPEEPGEAPFWVRFIQVRDIYTQKVVAAFQDSPFEDSNWGDEVQPYGKEEKGAEKYWKTLPGRTKALEYILKLGVDLKGKSRKSKAPEGSEIIAKVVGKAPRKSKFSLKKDKEGTGYDFRWDRISYLNDGKDDDGKHYSPFIHVEHLRAPDKQLLVKIRSRLSFEDIRDSADERKVYLEGSVWHAFGPKGRRVRVSYYEQVVGQHEENGDISRGAYYMRAVGPQIKIIDAGVGEENARKAARLFDAAGLHVTIVETAKEPTEGVTFYFRGESGKASAEAAAALLPTAVSEELTKKGWVDLIVVLGS